VGYRDKGTRKDEAFDGTPGWQHVAALPKQRTRLLSLVQNSEKVLQRVNGSEQMVRRPNLQTKLRDLYIQALETKYHQPLRLFSIAYGTFKPPKGGKPYQEDDWIHYIYELD
jgi:hypothetical protein